MPDTEEIEEIEQLTEQLTEQISEKHVAIRLDKDEVDVVIYHGNCPDGYGGAFTAHLYLSTNFPERQVTYHPASFEQKPPDITGKNVCIIDFSYNKTITEEILAKANKLLILDHHKTAQEALAGLPEINKVFMMDHSGAYLAWKYFYPDSPVPDLIAYIEDTDIWTKKLPFTNEYSTVIHTTQHTWEEFGKLMDPEYLRNKALTEGAAVLKQNATEVIKSTKYAAPKLVTIDNRHYFVAYLNSTTQKSEMGNKVFDVYPDANFSGIYSVDDYSNSTTFSLRSADDRTDVSRIAKFYGGGGHRNASGVRVPYLVSSLPCTVHDNYKMYSLLKSLYFDSINISSDQFNYATEESSDQTKQDKYIPPFSISMPIKKQYNVVYANSSSHKSVLAKYLLQTRYYETVDHAAGISKPVQECVSILRNRNKKNGLTTDILEYHVSIIWSYDGADDKTWMTIFFNPTLSEQDKQLFLKFARLNTVPHDYEKNDNTKFILCKNGLVNKLTF